jgi:hypothetical protein
MNKNKIWKEENEKEIFESTIKIIKSRQTEKELEKTKNNNKNENLEKIDNSKKTKKNCYVPLNFIGDDINIKYPYFSTKIINLNLNLTQSYNGIIHNIITHFFKDQISIKIELFSYDKSNKLISINSNQVLDDDFKSSVSFIDAKIY